MLLIMKLKMKNFGEMLMVGLVSVDDWVGLSLELADLVVVESPHLDQSHLHQMIKLLNVDLA